VNTGNCELLVADTTTTPSFGGIRLGISSSAPFVGIWIEPTVVRAITVIEMSGSPGCVAASLSELTQPFTTSPL
jgi:hypothetical protein